MGFFTRKKKQKKPEDPVVTTPTTPTVVKSSSFKSKSSTPSTPVVDSPVVKVNPLVKQYEKTFEIVTSEADTLLVDGQLKQLHTYLTSLNWLKEKLLTDDDLDANWKEQYVSSEQVKMIDRYFGKLMILVWEALSDVASQCEIDGEFVVECLSIILEEETLDENRNEKHGYKKEFYERFNQFIKDTFNDLVKKDDEGQLNLAATLKNFEQFFITKLSDNLPFVGAALEPNETIHKQFPLDKQIPLKYQEELKCWIETNIYTGEVVPLKEKAFVVAFLKTYCSKAGDYMDEEFVERFDTNPGTITISQQYVANAVGYINEKCPKLVQSDFENLDTLELFPTEDNFPFTPSVVDVFSMMETVLEQVLSLIIDLADASTFILSCLSQLEYFTKTMSYQVSSYKNALSIVVFCAMVNNGYEGIVKMKSLRESIRKLVVAINYPRRRKVPTDVSLVEFLKSSEPEDMKHYKEIESKCEYVINCFSELKTSIVEDFIDLIVVELQNDGFIVLFIPIDPKSKAPRPEQRPMERIITYVNDVLGEIEQNDLIPEKERNEITFAVAKAVATEYTKKLMFPSTVTGQYGINKPHVFTEKDIEDIQADYKLFLDTFSTRVNFRDGEGKKMVSRVDSQKLELMSQPIRLAIDLLTSREKEQVSEITKQYIQKVPFIQCKNLQDLISFKSELKKSKVKEYSKIIEGIFNEKLKEASTEGVLGTIMSSVVNSVPKNTVSPSSPGLFSNLFKSKSGDSASVLLEGFIPSSTNNLAAKRVQDEKRKERWVEKMQAKKKQ